MKRFSLYIDGAARGNPGPAGIGVVLLDGEGQEVAEIGEYIGETTNNVAEYRALIRGLEEALKYMDDEVHVFCDSQLVVRQVTGEYKVRHPGLKPLYQRVLSLVGEFASFQITHIPRGENKKADALANRGIDNSRG